MASSEAEIRAALEGDLKQKSLLADEVFQVAAQAANYARSIAPVGNTDDPHPGKFRDSIHAEDRPDHKGLPAARVKSDDPTASFKEFGTRDTPEHGTFMKTAAHFNLDTHTVIQ